MYKLITIIALLTLGCASQKDIIIFKSNGHSFQNDVDYYYSKGYKFYNATDKDSSIVVTMIK